MGVCPCFCNGHTAAFSLALCAVWIALTLSIVSLTLPDLYNAELRAAVARRGVVQLGMWQVCATYDISGVWTYSCDSYGVKVDLSTAFHSNSASAAFEAMRWLTAITAIALYVAGILGAIRLAYQQRAKHIPSLISRPLLISMWLALLTLSTALVLSTDLYRVLVNHTPAERGRAWWTLVTAFVALPIGLALHTIADRRYQRAMAQQQSAQHPGIDAPVYLVYPTGAMFPHPQPQYFSAAAAHPTATVFTQHQLHVQPSVQPSHGDVVEAPLPDSCTA